MEKQIELEEIRKKLGNFTSNYRNPISILEEKEKKFLDLQLFTEEIKENKKDHIVKLNIGGNLFETTIKTLLSFNNTIFQSLILQDKYDKISIERSPYLFQHILEYLRNKKISNKLRSNLDLLQEVIEEAKFYGLIIPKFEHIIKPDTNVTFTRLIVSGFYTDSFTNVSVLQVRDLSTHILTNSPGSIQVDFDKIYEFDTLEIGGVINNEEWETDNGYGIGARILTSLDGCTWTDIGIIPSGFGRSIISFPVTLNKARMLQLSHHSWLGIGYLNVIPISLM